MINSKLEEKKLNSKKDNMRNLIAVAGVVFTVINILEELRNTAVIIGVGFVFFCAYGILWAHHFDEERDIYRARPRDIRV